MFQTNADWYLNSHEQFKDIYPKLWQAVTSPSILPPEKRYYTTNEYTIKRAIPGASSNRFAFINPTQVEFDKDGLGNPIKEGHFLYDIKSARDQYNQGEQTQFNLPFIGYKLLKSIGLSPNYPTVDFFREQGEHYIAGYLSRFGGEHGPFTSHVESVLSHCTELNTKYIAKTAHKQLLL